MTVLAAVLVLVDLVLLLEANLARVGFGHPDAVR